MSNTLPELPYDHAAREPHDPARLLQLHQWKTPSPRGGGVPAGELAAAVAELFGSFTGLERQLTGAAMHLQGSGWGALGGEPLGGRLVVEQIHDHQGNVGNGTVPLLVLDMWEHADHLQHENIDGTRVEALWKPVDWPDVAKRFPSVRTLDPVLSRSGSRQ